MTALNGIRYFLKAFLDLPPNFKTVLGEAGGLKTDLMWDGGVGEGGGGGGGGELSGQVIGTVNGQVRSILLLGSLRGSQYNLLCKLLSTKDVKYMCTDTLCK